MVNCISIMMLSRSKWVAAKECNFNYAINSLSAGTDSYQRADRISFLTLMKYKHSGFNLPLSFLIWCSRGWKTPSPFFWYEVYLPGSIHLFVLFIPCFFMTWISCDDIMMFTAFLAMAETEMDALFSYLGVVGNSNVQAAPQPRPRSPV